MIEILRLALKYIAVIPHILLLIGIAQDIKENYDTYSKEDWKAIILITLLVLASITAIALL